MDSLKNYEILLGVTGGIAAYKTADLASRLVQAGAGVTVAMTAHAEKFVGKLTFSTLTGREVYTDLFDSPEIYDARHIDITRRADLFVIAPATANFLAKAANGICDDLLSTLYCSRAGTVLLAPAMNQRMWAAPATGRNIETLRADGCRIIGPETGNLACRETGPGRMAEPADIFNKITELLKPHKPKSLKKE